MLTYFDLLVATLADDELVDMWPMYNLVEDHSTENHSIAHKWVSGNDSTVTLKVFGAIDLCIITSANGVPHTILATSGNARHNMRPCKIAIEQNWNNNISNNSNFRQKHPGVPDCSDGSDGTSYPLTENYTLPVAQATGRVAYLLLYFVVTFTHHQKDTCVTLFAGAAVMRKPFTQRLAM